MYGSVCYTHYSQNSVAILLYIIYSWFVWQCPLYFYLYGSTYTLYCILYLSDSVRYTTVYSWFVWLFARYYIHYLFVSIDYIYNLSGSINYIHNLLRQSPPHRRRMKLEDKAKVVASVCGAEFVQFLAALTVLPWSIWKNRMNSTFSSKSTRVE